MEVFHAWKEEENGYEGQGHRRNMLDRDMKYVGLACVEKDGIKYWVQSFNDASSGKKLPPSDNSMKMVHADMLKEKIEREGYAYKNQEDSSYQMLENFLLEIELLESVDLVEILLYIKGIQSNPIYLDGSLIRKEVMDKSMVELSEDGILTGLKVGETTIKLTMSFPSGTDLERDIRVVVKENEEIGDYVPRIKALFKKDNDLMVDVLFRKGYIVKLQYGNDSKMANSTIIEVTTKKPILKDLNKVQDYYLRVGKMQDGEMEWEKIYRYRGKNRYKVNIK